MTADGVNILYVDFVNNVSDTVHVFVPAVRSGAVADAKTGGQGTKAVKVKDEDKKMTLGLLIWSRKTQTRNRIPAKYLHWSLQRKRQKNWGINPKL